MPVVTSRAAQEFAERVHDGALDRYGAPLLDHVCRVAAAVPREARVVAWLHEVFERTTVSVEQLRAAGVSATQIAAIELLTRDADAGTDDYEAHIEHIVQAPGRSGRLARIVKRADLDDRLRHEYASIGPRPPYRRALLRLGGVPRRPPPGSGDGSPGRKT